jgi:hypothetical protein
VAGVTEVLATWEAGLAAGESDRALLLHGLARPGADRDALLDTPVGRRDADLFGLRRRLFGPTAQIRLGCPGCGEELEAGFDVAALAESAQAEGDAPAGPLRVTADEWSVLVRPPSVGDLRALAGSAPDALSEPGGTADPARARAALLAQCVLEVTRGGEPARADQLPVAVQRRLATAVAEADPYADVRLDMACPGCGERTAAVLDIASFLWSEIEAWARATLLDVHLLATAYGWSEPEVLALTPWRRRYYLELSGHV